MLSKKLEKYDEFIEIEKTYSNLQSAWYLTMTACLIMETLGPGGLSDSSYAEVEALASDLRQIKERILRLSLEDCRSEMSKLLLKD